MSGPESQPRPVAGIQKDRVEKWKSQQFYSMTDQTDFREMIAGFDIQLRVDLDARERENLTNAAASFLAAFQKGTYEEFTKFRIPVKTFHFSRGVSNYIRKELSIPVETIRGDPFTAWKKYWDTTVGDKFSNYWVGISITNCEIIVERSKSPTNDLKDSLSQSSPLFAIDSIRVLAPLAKRIKEAEPTDKISQHITLQLSDNTRNLLLSYHPTYFTEVQKALLNDLNRIIQSGALYEPARFANVKLSEGTMKLLKENPQGAELVRLNRMLLVDAYPYALSPYSPVENVGMTWSTPMIELEPSREEILKKNAFIKTATIKVLCQPKDNLPVFPIYLRLYWSPEGEKWLPEQLIGVYSRRDRRFDLVF
jgi:hypothetical protein